MTKAEREAALLASALRILTAPPRAFTLTDWRTTVPKALADDKANAIKAATKKAAAKGITKPKHTPTASTQADPVGSAFGALAMSQLGGGVDAKRKPVLESKHASKGASALNHRSQENTVTTDTQEKAAAKQAEKAAALQAKMAEKAAKQEAARKAKEEKAAAAEAKKAEAAKAKEEKAAAAAAKKAEREAAKAEREANKTPRERTYTGSMLSLADRVAAGQYVKGKNGQLRSNDDVALALESLPAKQVVPVVLGILGLDANPYAHLNYGQQSMNLRNKLRGAIKAGTKVGEGEDAPVINLERVQSFVADALEATARATPAAA